MPAVAQFPIKDMLSQVNKCGKMENKGGEAGDGRSLVVVGLVVTLVALFLAITSYYQRWPFNHPASSLIPSVFVRACPPSTLIVNYTNIFSASQSTKASFQSSPSKPLNHHSAGRFGWGQTSLYF